MSTTQNDQEPPLAVRGDDTVSHKILGSLRQTETWTTHDNRVIPIAELEPRHAQNIIRYCERQARHLAYAAQLELMCIADGPLGPRGEMAQDAVEKEFDELGYLAVHDPLRWLHTQPLWVHLEERARGPIPGGA